MSKGILIINDEEISFTASLLDINSYLNACFLYLSTVNSYNANIGTEIWGVLVVHKSYWFHPAHKFLSFLISKLDKRGVEDVPTNINYARDVLCSLVYAGLNGWKCSIKNCDVNYFIIDGQIVQGAFAGYSPQAMKNISQQTCLDKATCPYDRHKWRAAKKSSTQAEMIELAAGYIPTGRLTKTALCQGMYTLHMSHPLTLPQSINTGEGNST